LEFGVFNEFFVLKFGIIGGFFSDLNLMYFDFTDLADFTVRFDFKIRDSSELSSDR